MTIRADVLNRQAENTLSVKMEIVQIPQAMAKDMMGVEKKERQLGYSDSGEAGADRTAG